MYYVILNLLQGNLSLNTKIDCKVNFSEYYEAEIKKY